MNTIALGLTLGWEITVLLSGLVVFLIEGKHAMIDLFKIDILTDSHHMGF